jgi:hypothetical protein
MRPLASTQDNLGALTPTGGRLIYNSTSQKYYVADGNAFQRMMSMNYDKLGINTLTPTYTLDVVSNSSMALRLVASGEEAEFILNNGINIQTPNNVNISNHNQSVGLSLAGSRVYSTAIEINYSAGAIPGNAQGGKVMVIDQYKNISGVNAVSLATLSATTSITTPSASITALSAATLSATTSLTTPSASITALTSQTISATTSITTPSANIAAITTGTIGAGVLTLSTPLSVGSGGSGVSSYTKGDILVATETNTLQKLPRSTVNGAFLTSDSRDTTYGLQWGVNVMSNYFAMSQPTLAAQGRYGITFIRCRNYTDTDYIALNNVTSDATTESSLLGGILTGTIFPDSESATLTGTGFSTQLKTNDSLVITTSGVNVATQVRRVIAVNSDTSITLSSPFTLLNLWALAGTATMSATQKKFGTKSLNATATTAYASLTSIASPSVWTLEFFVYFSAVTAALSVTASNAANVLQIGLKIAPVNFTISIGQGTSFNIANATALTTTTVVAATWYHFALVFNGSTYRAFINGALATTITSALTVPTTCFNSLKAGGGTSTFNGFIDELRLSNTARYTTAFTAPTAQFTKDANTIALNHFEGTTITKSDECAASSAVFPYYRNTQFASAAVQIIYSYAINDAVYLSPRGTEADVVDIPSKYATAPSTINMRKIPVYHVMTAGGVYITTSHDGWHLFSPSISVTSNSTAVVATSVYMDAFTPVDATLVRLLITHTHVGTVSCGVVVGAGAGWFDTYLTTATAGTYQIVVDLPIFGQTIQAYLSAAASTTSYNIQCMGFYVPQYNV